MCIYTMSKWVREHLRGAIQYANRDETKTLICN